MGKHGSTVMIALAVVVCVFIGSACKNHQTIYSCRACLRDDPSRCQSYEGFCYGPASNSMSANSVEEAKELAVRRVCSQWFEPVPASGLQAQCKIGLGVRPEVIAETYSHYNFTCTQHEEECP